MRMSRGGQTAADKVRVVVVVTTLVLAGVVSAQAPEGEPPALTVEQIAARMQLRNQWRAAALHSYVSRRVMTVGYKGPLPDRQAKEVVEMTFTAPATKKFKVLSSEGPAVLVDGVLQRAMDSEVQATAEGDIAVTPETYNMRLVGRERLPQGDCYVVQVSPRNKGKYGFEGKIWVQSPDFAVVRVEAQPVENPSFWVKDGEFQTEYQKVDRFWFPAKMTSTSRVRFGGEATLTILYGPYKIISADATKWPPE